MQVLSDIKSTRQVISELKKANKTIGLVPTMGALHEGHISLIKRSVKDNDVTFASIFVNPIQFNNQNDLKHYPSSISKDLDLLTLAGCDFVFIPENGEMYPSKPELTIGFGHLDLIMESKHRPGHFNGVAIVVLKLLNIITPSLSYFGQKDLQQFKIIERLVGDLSLPVKLVLMPIIRESSGLAMSSRNQRLSQQGKNTASEIYKALLLAQDAYLSGQTIKKSMNLAEQHLQKFPDISIEYLEAAKTEDLKSLTANSQGEPLTLCFAGYLEDVRLIDNIIIAM